MIISNSNRFIFIHIHKCGGTSITKSLDKVLRWNDIQCGGTPYGERFQHIYKERFGLYKHIMAHQIKEVAGSNIWNSYLTFTFIQNPFYRAASLCTWIKKTVDNPKQKLSEIRSWPLTQAYLETKSFPQFIRYDKFKQDPGSLLQFNSASDLNQNKIIADYIGRLENIDEDFNEILKKIKLNNLFLVKANVSNKLRNLDSYYETGDDYEVLYNLCKIDFKIFGFNSTLKEM